MYNIYIYTTRGSTTNDNNYTIINQGICECQTMEMLKAKMKKIRNAHGQEEEIKEDNLMRLFARNMRDEKSESKLGVKAKMIQLVNEILKKGVELMRNEKSRTRGDSILKRFNNIFKEWDEGVLYMLMMHKVGGEGIKKNIFSFTTCYAAIAYIEEGKFEPSTITRDKEDYFRNLTERVVGKFPGRLFDGVYERVRKSTDETCFAKSIRIALTCIKTTEEDKVKIDLIPGTKKDIEKCKVYRAEGVRATWCNKEKHGAACKGERCFYQDVLTGGGLKTYEIVMEGKTGGRRISNVLCCEALQGSRCGKNQCNDIEMVQLNTKVETGNYCVAWLFGIPCSKNGKYDHEFKKDSLCSNFINGNCERGVKCERLHAWKDLTLQKEWTQMAVYPRVLNVFGGVKTKEMHRIEVKRSVRVCLSNLMEGKGTMYSKLSGEDGLETDSECKTIIRDIEELSRNTVPRVGERDIRKPDANRRNEKKERDRSSKTRERGRDKDRRDDNNRRDEGRGRKKQRLNSVIVAESRGRSAIPKCNKEDKGQREDSSAKKLKDDEEKKLVFEEQVRTILKNSDVYKGELKITDISYGIEGRNLMNAPDLYIVMNREAWYQKPDIAQKDIKKVVTSMCGLTRYKVYIQMMTSGKDSKVDIFEGSEIMGSTPLALYLSSITKGMSSITITTNKHKYKVEQQGVICDTARQENKKSYCARCLENKDEVTGEGIAEQYIKEELYLETLEDTHKILKFIAPFRICLSCVDQRKREVPTMSLTKGFHTVIYLD